jgi:hypothetical protein
MLAGLDILVLLKLSLKGNSRILSKHLAEDLFVPPSEISLSLKRCRASRLLNVSDIDKQINRAGLLEFLVHGLKYIFPAERGEITRGIPTATGAEPLKGYFQGGVDPPVWPYVDGTVRGPSLKPLHKSAPQAAMRDPKLYELLALVDAIRGERIRERSIAVDELRKRMNDNAQS